jgi:tetratricopeptide (TPR) repeat protein
VRPAALIAIILVAATATASATPAQELERGRLSFRARDWQSSIPVLTALLYPDPQLSRGEDLVEAHVLLGAAHFESGNRDRAQDEFEKALQIDPERSITTLTFSAGAVRLFDQVKEEQHTRIERDAERKRLAEAAERLEAYRKSLVVYETRPFYLNFMPFGLAQYTQKRRAAGVLFTIGQGTMIAANLGIYGYLVGTYGFKSTSVPVTDGPRVRRLQQVQIGTGVAFLGLYAWGVFDAIRHHKPRQQIQGDDSLIPPDLLDPTKRPAPKKTSLRDRLQLAPMVTHDSVGIGIGWEN